METAQATLAYSSIFSFDLYKKTTNHQLTLNDLLIPIYFQSSKITNICCQTESQIMEPDARQIASNLEATISNQEMEISKLQDQLADSKLENDELKQSVLESHQSLAAAQSSLDSAKQIASRYEQEAEHSNSQVDGLQSDISLLQEDLRLKIEDITMLETDASSRGARKEELQAIKRVSKKLAQQLTLATDSSSRRQNDLQNQLHASQKICQTQRLELDEFTAQLRTEWAVDKAENEARVARLRRRYARLRTLQFEDKQQLLRESQEVVRAMQSQFEEFRRLAEHLFSIEAKQLEHKLHTQVSSYEEELRYVVLSKDRDYDQMVKAKDAKIMSLIEGTDFNAILIKHAMELQQSRQRHVEAVATLRREWKVISRKDKAAMEAIISDRDADIEALKHRIETAEERHRHLQESVEAQRTSMQERQERRDDEYRDKAWEIEKLNKKCKHLVQIKLNLRHQVLKMKLDATGGYNESLVSLVNRLKSEIDKLHLDHESLQQQYGTVALERTTLRKKLNKTKDQRDVLDRSLQDQRLELEQTAVTLKRSIRRRAQELKSGINIKGMNLSNNYSHNNYSHNSDNNNNDNDNDNDNGTPRRTRRTRSTRSTRRIEEHRLPEQHDDLDEEDDFEDNEDDYDEEGLLLQSSSTSTERIRRERIASAGLGRLSTSLDIETREMFPPTPKQEGEEEEEEKDWEEGTDTESTRIEGSGDTTSSRNENDNVVVKLPPLEENRQMASPAGGWDQDNNIAKKLTQSAPDVI